MSIFNRRPIEPHQPWHVGGWHQARDTCTILGLDTTSAHVETLSVADFVRLAYNLGEKATESRLASRDVADGIATAIQMPEAILERNAGETDHMWRVRAVQQVVAFGAPQPTGGAE